MVRARPESIFYHQWDVESYTDLVLVFSYCFYLFLKIWLTKFLFSENSFSEKLASLLTSNIQCHNLLPMKISSFHWKGVCTIVRRNYGRELPASIQGHNLNLLIDGSFIFSSAFSAILSTARYLPSGYLPPRTFTPETFTLGHRPPRTLTSRTFTFLFVIHQTATILKTYLTRKELPYMDFLKF